MRTLFSIALLFILAGCDSTLQEPDAFEGTWEWEGTSHGGWGYSVPSVVGYSLTLSLRDGEYTLQRDGAAVQTGSYRLYPYRQGGGLQIEVRFDRLLADDVLAENWIGGGDTSMYADREQPNPDILHLSEGCCDRNSYVFRREGTSQPRSSTPAG